MTQPKAATGPGPIFLARGPAAIDQNGTSSGPGATARPVCSADQPQTSWHQRVTSSSIEPKAVPNTTFAAGARANVGRRRRRDVSVHRPHELGPRRDKAEGRRRGPAPVVRLDHGEGERTDRDGEDR